MRPTTLNEFKGKSNRNIVERLQIAIISAKKRNEALDHVLLYGPAGTGKTTLAQAIANEMGAKLVVRTGGSITNQKDLFAVVYEIDSIQTSGSNAVLFFDEIHKLSGVKDMPEEMFYSLIEEYVFYSNLAGKKIVLNGKEGIVTHNVIKTERHFTIVGATTAPGMLQKPLRERFKIKCSLKLYSPEDLIEIVQFNARKENIPITDEAAFELAQRARGTPRIVINFLRNCRDRTIYAQTSKIDVDIVKKEMQLQGIEDDGLDELDLKILQTLAENPKGLGLKTLAGICSVDVTTLQEMIVPCLSANGYIKTTSKRFITELGIKRLTRKRI